MWFEDLCYRTIKKTLTWTARKLPSCGSVWMLHECIDDVSKADDKQYAVSVESFEQLIKKKISENFKFCCLDDLYESDSNSIFVTFDDGRECVYYDALPILQKYNIPFCVFVITGRIGQKGYLSNKELLSLDSCHLCTLGAHTVSHNRLRQCSSRKVWEELTRSKLELETIVTHEIKYFAFPYGDIRATSLRDVRLARKCNYSMAFSTLQSHMSKLFLYHKFFIPRWNVNDEFVEQNF